MYPCYAQPCHDASHLREHLAAGRHVPGILVVKIGYPSWKLAEDLHLIWGAVFPTSSVTRFVYLAETLIHRRVLCMPDLPSCS